MPAGQFVLWNGHRRNQRGQEGLGTDKWFVSRKDYFRTWGSAMFETRAGRKLTVISYFLRFERRTGKLSRCLQSGIHVQTQSSSYASPFQVLVYPPLTPPILLLQQGVQPHGSIFNFTYVTDRTVGRHQVEVIWDNKMFLNKTLRFVRYLLHAIYNF